MPFDALTMAAVADELNALACGGRIQKIIQPSETAVGLSIYREGKECWLILSADARSARVSVASRRLAKAFATPSAFVMLLRKHLDGMRLAGVTQVPKERVLMLRGRGREGEVRLIAEAMGKHSNVIVVDEHDRVLGALKIVPPSQSSVRPILPGRPYQLPPARPRDPTLFSPGDRIDPTSDAPHFLAVLGEAPPATPVQAALLGLLPGASPFLTVEIATRAEVSPDTPVAAVEADTVLAASVQLYRLYQTRSWQPCTFTDRRGRRDFAPYLPVHVSDVVAVRSMSEAIEASLGIDESHDALKSTRDALLTEVRRRQRNAARKLASLEEGLAAAGEAESVMEQGQLVLAYQHRVKQGATELVVPELEVIVPLDPKHTPKENAERLFRRYRKLRDARQRLPGLVAEAEAEAAQLDDAAVFARLAGSEAELRDLRRELFAPPATRAGRKAKRETRKGPLRLTRDGYSALVGRSARENEEVTFRLARRSDLWLHARQRTGAHVVVQGAADELPDDVVAAAAGLAAYFSDGRDDTAVDVDVTPVRNVRKVPGGPPGRVTYQHFRTVRVQPSLDGWASRDKR